MKGSISSFRSKNASIHLRHTVTLKAFQMHSFEIDFNKVLTVTFDQSKASLLNKTINLLYLEAEHLYDNFKKDFSDAHSRSYYF